MKIADAAIATIVKKISKSWNSELNRYGEDSQVSIAKEINKHFSGLVDAQAFTLDFLSGLSTVDNEEIAHQLTAAIENVDGDHWVAFPMTLLDGGFHTFSTDMTLNEYGFEQEYGLSENYDLADPTFGEPGARQRGFIELSKRLAVHEPDAEGVLKIQEIENEREWLNSNKPVEFSEATTLLCVKVRGFVGNWYKCPLFQSRCEALVKTILLLGQWESVGNLRPRIRGDYREEGVLTDAHPDHRFSLFFDPSRENEFKEGITIDPEISFALSNHGFCDWNYTVNEENDLVVAVGDIAHSKREFFKMHSAGIGRLIDDYESYLDLINAAQWCFDACRLTKREPVKAFLFLGIAWDALLGSKGGSANITSTLGDRLAYLISQTREEREEILSDFKRFYQVRSKVVHGRLAWLDESETEAYEWGLRAFKKAFEKELELI